MKRFFDWFNNLYPVWLVTLAVVAFLFPPVMLWFNSDWVFWSLAASMLGMGLTLSLADFSAILGGCREVSRWVPPRNTRSRRWWVGARQRCLD